MIRLPSFFRPKSQSNDLETGSLGRRVTQRPVPRAFQRNLESEELAFTEDPEQQRARHRLIGASVLVLIAVIGLPRILDNKPKAVNNDIAINIVTSLPTPSVEHKPDVKPEEKAKADAPAAAQSVAPVVAPKPVVSASEAKVEPKAEVKPVNVANKAPSTLGLAEGEEVVSATSNGKSKVDATLKNSDSASTKNSVKYGIPVGSFASDDSIKNVTAKLKELKIPFTTAIKTRPDGAKLTVFRAGPFSDKDAAEAAEKKIKATLNPAAKTIEIGKQ
jgi:DedD protein